MNLNLFDTLVIVVSRQEVLEGDTATALATLRHLLSSPEIMNKFRTRVDISFHGYDDTTLELAEIPEVREYVRNLDQEFPYWLYFLSREHTGLQCLTYCFLLPSLTEQARKERHPKQLADLIDKRWGPALAHICAAAGNPQFEVESLLDSAIDYFFNGPQHSSQA